tara:strand:+ start:1219 stop:1959 length:741 start_codon:yes stop_codon:yes gene_type:complete
VSISGWYHGPPLKYNRSLPPPTLLPWTGLQLKSEIIGENFAESSMLSLGTWKPELSKFISSVYLDIENVEKIAEQFREEGSVELQQFLSEDVFQQVMSAFHSMEPTSASAKAALKQEKKKSKKPLGIRGKKREEEVKQKAEITAQLPCLPGSQAGPYWKTIGPVNRRHYYQYLGEGEDDTCKSVRDVLLFLQSEAFVHYLRALTNMVAISVRAQARRFSHGCYTLMSDDNKEADEEALDLMLCCVE